MPNLHARQWAFANDVQHPQTKAQDSSWGKQWNLSRVELWAFLAPLKGAGVATAGWRGLAATAAVGGTREADRVTKPFSRLRSRTSRAVKNHNYGRAISSSESERDRYKKQKLNRACVRSEGGGKNTSQTKHQRRVSHCHTRFTFAFAALGEMHWFDGFANSWLQFWSLTVIHFLIRLNTSSAESFSCNIYCNVKSWYCTKLSASFLCFRLVITYNYCYWFLYQWLDMHIFIVCDITL